MDDKWIGRDLERERIRRQEVCSDKTHWTKQPENDEEDNDPQKALAATPWPAI